MTGAGPLAQSLGLRVESARRGDPEPEQAVDHHVDRVQVGEGHDVHEWPALLEYNSEAAPPVPLPNVALKLSVTYPATEDGETEEEGPDDPQPHNIFYLEGVFVRLDS